MRTDQRAPPLDSEVYEPHFRDRTTTCATRLLALMLVLTQPGVVQAQFSYFTNNGTITITAYTGPAGAVTIPDMIDGLPVTTIGYPGFSTYDSMISVVIPNSVTQIDRTAFYGSNLRSVTISSSTLSIGIQAFAASLSLTNVTIIGPVSSIGDGAFALCTSLPDFTIPDGVYSIEEATFQSCYSLANVTIPAGVTNIGNHAFYECTSLANAQLPGTITTIGGYVYAYCSSLTNLTIPASVAQIGDRAIYRCNSLNSIVVDDLSSFFGSVDGVLFNKDASTLIAFPGGKAGSYTVPSNVKRIENSAFDSCLYLVNVSVPDSVTCIGEELFYTCLSLTNVTIGNGITNLGNGTFYFSTNLTGIYFRGNAPTFDSTAFYGTELTIYYLPGTTGWGPTFGDHQTGLWRPRVVASDASFGVRTNQFGFNIAWASGQVVVVEACANLTDPIWSPLQTNTLTSDSLYFSDPQWTNYPGRFYRLRSP